jgi:ribosomal protein L19E
MRKYDPNPDKAKKQFGEIIAAIREEANRLKELKESGKISEEKYKRLMWEHLGVPSLCIQ